MQFDIASLFAPFQSLFESLWGIIQEILNTFLGGFSLPL